MCVCVCGHAWWLSLQYSCLENPMDRGAWWDTVHGVAKELDTHKTTTHTHTHTHIIYTHAYICMHIYTFI